MFEVVVIGGGPSGVTAALRARELGATVALIESEHMGGVSTNDGCVPTRVLAKAARLVRDAEQFADYGLEGEPPTVNFVRLLNHTEHVVRTVQQKKQLRAQLEAADVRVFDGVGDASFLDSHTLALGNGSSVQAEKFILCVGGHARRIPLPGGEHALTHSDVWTMKGLPESVAVVGGAATGCQLASVFAAFGSRVTLLEVSPRILAAEDEVVSDGVTEAFGRRGIEMVTGIGGVEKVERENGRLSLFYAKNDETHTLAVETIMFAVGWPGNVEGLNLEAVGVETRRGGYVQVDDALRTSAPHIFAAGDITGRMMLVQSATNEGNLAAEQTVLGGEHGYRHTIVPHGGFTVAVVPYAELDRGVVDGHTEGLCKLLVDRRSRRILGAHIVGEQAVEVVQIVATAMRAGMPVEQLADVEFAYPTFTAIVGIAARRLLRELGLVAVSPRWGIPERTLGAEWEHSDQNR
jgi:pyruvate/2-oxoglutarate dehydrogenase complex dihydrolipoamide dehydrogenase (E3) component